MNKKIAFIFPGQGAQYPGMGKDLYEKSAAAKKIFDRADEVLNMGLSNICFFGSEDELKRTDICQPAILTMSIACLEALKEAGIEGKKNPDYCAGLSLGEYSALVAAGVLSFQDALKLVRTRGELMEEVARKTSGKMVSIIGLDDDRVRKICVAAGVYIANLNCPGQIVISGEAKSIERASQEALNAGALKAIPLEVSGAFHSPLMQEASVKLSRELSSYSFKSPSIKVIFNVTAGYEADPEKIKSNLIKQVASSVLWQDSIRFILKFGVSDFIEAGPGKVLKGLLRRINSSALVCNVESYEDVKRAVL